MGTLLIAHLQLCYKIVSYLRKDTQKTVLIKRYDPPPKSIHYFFWIIYLTNTIFPPFIGETLW